MKYYEFHCHLGGSVPSRFLWEHAKLNGMETLFDTFSDFNCFLTKIGGHDQFLSDHGPHKVIERIQKGPDAVYKSAFTALSHAYHSNAGQLAHFELRFDPSSRALHQTVESIKLVVAAAKRGLIDAGNCYDVSTKLTVCIDRRIMSPVSVLVDAAIAGGATGLDVCCVEEGQEASPEWVAQRFLADFKRAYTSGLDLTYHVGENVKNDRVGAANVVNVIECLPVARIGHGIALLRDLNGQSMKVLNKVRGVAFEFCPSLYLITASLTEKEIALCLQSAFDHGVVVLICTDNPVLLNTSLRKEWEVVRNALAKYSHSPQLIERWLWSCSSKAVLSA